jgi:hypothetical protein
MGLVIEICVKYPGGPTRIRGAGISDHINSSRIWLFTSGRSRQRRNKNRTTTMDPTGEIFVGKSGCTLHCISQEAAAKSGHAYI